MARHQGLRADDPDRDLVRRCQVERSPEAFRQLYLRHKDRVINTAYYLIGDREEALEAVQEVFLRVYRQIGKFRGQSSFASWLYRITVNVATDSRRRLGRQRELLEAYFRQKSGGRRWSVPAGGVGRSEEPASRRETALIIRHAIAQLSPKLAAVVTLRYLEDRSYEEIAEILGISLGTVKSRLNRAHRALAPLLARLAPENEEPQ